MKRKKKKLNLIKVFKTLCMMVGLIVITTYTVVLMIQWASYMKAMNGGSVNPPHSHEYKELMKRVRRRKLDELG